MNQAINRGLLGIGLVLAMALGLGAGQSPARAQQPTVLCIQGANQNGVVGCVPVSNANPLPTSSSAATTTTTPTSETGGTVAVGNTFQVVLAANPARTGCVVQNTSLHTGYVYYLGTGTPTLTNSIQLAAGQAFYCQNPGNGVIKTQIQFTTGTAADPFVVTENQ